MNLSQPCRRTFLVTTGTLTVGGLAGCIGGDGEVGGEPVVSETIDSEEEWVLELNEGNRVRIVAEDNDDTAFIEYVLEPPEGTGTRQTRTSVDQTYDIDVSGEHVLRIDPTRETDVEIFVG